MSPDCIFYPFDAIFRIRMSAEKFRLARPTACFLTNLHDTNQCKWIITSLDLQHYSEVIGLNFLIAAKFY